MSDRRDALLAEAARLIRDMCSTSSAGPDPGRRINAWLARYEAERAGRSLVASTARPSDKSIDQFAIRCSSGEMVETFVAGTVIEWIDEAEQRGAERERAMCHELARNYAVARDNTAITARVAHLTAYGIADAIAARTAPATPGKEDGE